MEYPFWDEFVNKILVTEREETLVSEILREQLPEDPALTTKQAIHRRQEYKKTEEYRALLESRKAADEFLQSLPESAPEGDKRYLARYKKFMQKYHGRERRANAADMSAYLHNLELREITAEYVEYYAAESIREVENSLKTRNFMKSLRRGGERLPFSDLADALCTEIPADFYSPERTAKLARVNLVQALMDRDPKLSEWAKDPALLPKLRRMLEEKVARLGLKSRIMNAVSRHFTKDAVLACLGQNPYTAKEARTYLDKDGRISSLRAAILETIPADIKELYPLARRLNRHFVIHSGPTNSGKTYTALERFKQAGSGVYLGPLRLLAYEVFESANLDEVRCSMITGEERIEVPFSYHVASTVEMLDVSEHYDVAIVDECQMIADPERGGAWTRAILGLNADEIHLCCSPNAEEILQHLAEYCGDTWELVRHERRYGLLVEDAPFSFPENVRDGDALIVFSKRSVLLCAAELQNHGIACSVIYGALPYDVRQNEVRRFLSGETKVVVATDAIGMGLNLPVDRIVFLETEKFDGSRSRPLQPAEIQQIAGRAGRLSGKPGYVNSASFKRSIRAGLATVLPQIPVISLGFPRELLELPGKVSTIMENWSAMNAPYPFKKSDLSLEVSLAEELEERSHDKEKIFQFIMIPFKESDNELKKIWFRLFRLYDKGKKAGYAELCPDYDPGSLQSMEYAYQVNDLLFYYMRLTEQEEEQLLVMDEKREISAAINTYLAEHPLESKKCNVCGKVLPWNYKFRCCEDCFSLDRPVRAERPYGRYRRR